MSEPVELHRDGAVVGPGDRPGQGGGGRQVGRDDGVVDEDHRRQEPVRGPTALEAVTGGEVGVAPPVVEQVAEDRWSEVAL